MNRKWTSGRHRRAVDAAIPEEHVKILTRSEPNRAISVRADKGRCSTQARPPNPKTHTVKDVGDIHGNFEDDSDRELPSLKTLLALAKACKDDESLSDLLLKTRESNRGKRSGCGIFSVSAGHN